MLSACDSLLDVEADNAITGEVLVDTESVQKALTGCYYTFNGINDGSEGGELMGGDFILIPELLARVSPNGAQEYIWESILAPSSYQNFISKQIVETNDRVEANWSKAYETINALNNILTNISVVSDQNERNRIMGEALAMRGILLYEMVILWAPHYGAPDIDPSTKLALPFTTIAYTDINDIPKLSSADLLTIQGVYDQAEADLIQASNVLESFGANGTGLSYYACQAYLAKLNLQIGEFAKAETYATEVINGPFELMASPLDAFNNASNCSEDIYAIQQTLARNVGDRNSGSGLTAYVSSLTESGLGVYRYSAPTLTKPDEWENSPNFDGNDLRGSIDINVTESTSSEEITTAFYASLADDYDDYLSVSKYSSSSNVLPIIRLAEMYLIRCEANYSNLNDNISSQALEDLNKIRVRAGITELTMSHFPDQSTFFDSLVVERSREFLMEGMLLEDLKRWGGFVGSSITPASNYDPWDYDDEYDFELPIPRSERDTWSD